MITAKECLSLDSWLLIPPNIIWVWNRYIIQLGLTDSTITFFFYLFLWVNSCYFLHQGHSLNLCLLPVEQHAIPFCFKKAMINSTLSKPWVYDTSWWNWLISPIAPSKNCKKLIPWQKTHVIIGGSSTFPYLRFAIIIAFYFVETIIDFCKITHSTVTVNKSHPNCCNPKAVERFWIGVWNIKLCTAEVYLIISIENKIMKTTGKLLFHVSPKFGYHQNFWPRLNFA